MKAILEIPCSDPKLIKKSLEPDAVKGKVKVSLSTTKNTLKIKIECEKISHLKGVINTYLSLLKMLLEVDKVG